MPSLPSTSIDPPDVRAPVVAAAAAFAAAWVVVLIALSPPVLDPGIRLAVMHAFATICHQMPDRTFHVDAVPLALCHRCLGVFAGLAMGAGIGLTSRASRERAYRHAGGFIVVALVPLALDWTLDVVGLIRNTTASRFATGAVFGLLLGVLLIAALRTKTQVSPYAATDQQ